MTRARLLTLLVLAGCGLGEPTGVAQLWPPPLGASVEAALGADVDSDGISDLAVVSSGNSSQAGAYFIHGDTNLAAGVVPTKFATFASLPLTPPAAATSIPERIFVVYSESNHVELARFGRDFAPIEPPVALELEPSATVLWVAPVGGVATAGLLVGNGRTISYLQQTGTELPVAPTLAPPVVLGATYDDGGNQTILVASATDAQTAVLSPAGTIGAWTSARSGPAWVAQTAVDLDRDGYPELLGYDPAMRAVCFVEVTFGRTGCVALSSASQQAASEIFVGDFQGAGALDIVVLFAGAQTFDVAIVGDIAYDGSTLTATGQGFSGNLAIPQAHGLVIARGAARKLGLVVAARNGGLTCAVCN